jgi:hypothetical protein
VGVGGGGRRLFFIASAIAEAASAVVGIGSGVIIIGGTRDPTPPPPDCGIVCGIMPVPESTPTINPEPKRIDPTMPIVHMNIRLLRFASIKPTLCMRPPPHTSETVVSSNSITQTAKKPPNAMESIPKTIRSAPRVFVTHMTYLFLPDVAGR